MYFQTISMMKQILDTKINMKGHTDSDRNNESNLKLSEARAKAFVEAITNGGINAS
ncbi:MAG: OmpA family protein [Ignavibacteriaceae bacterium]|jgi:outer membrane protein OmpA-like peptidoglycan-associated protein